MDSVHAIVMTGNNRKGSISKDRILKGAHNLFPLGDVYIPKCYATIPNNKGWTNSASVVANAALASHSVRGVTIIGPGKYFDLLRLNSSDRTQLVPQRENASFSDNIYDSYDFAVRNNRINADEGVLYLSGDTPFRTLRTIEHFVSKVNSDDDVAVSLIRERELERFYYVYQKPLMPFSMGDGLEGRVSWFKPDEITYIRVPKLPREDIEMLYQRRHQNRLTWILEIKSIFKERYPNLGEVVLSGWALKQFHRLTRSLPDSINSLGCFNHILSKEHLEALARMSPLCLNANIFETPWAEGYVDIDNETDYSKIIKNYDEISSDMSR
jgi:hypothetical protein